MSVPPRSNVYKKYQCRYFDERGRPLSPSCRLGDKCRFVHPGDRNWPGLKASLILAKPYAAHKSNGGKGKPASNTGSQRTSRSDNSPHPRSALVSQTDLFKLCKDENDENDEVLSKDDRHQRSDQISRATTNNGVRNYDQTRSDLARGRKREKSREGGRSRNRSPTPSIPSPTPRLRSQKVDKRPEGQVPRDTLEKECKHDQDRGSAVSSANGQHSETPHESLVTKERLDKMINLFRGLAQVSSQSFQNTAAYDVEEKKLQTYTKISTALSKVSSAVGASIAPTLADILLEHAKCRRRMDDDFTAMGNLWEQIFDVFVSEVVGSIDRRLEDGLASLKAEVENATEEIEMFNAGSKRKHGDASIYGDDDSGKWRRSNLSRKDNEGSCWKRTLTGDHKRRRMEAWSSSPSPEPHGTAGDMARLNDVLNQMKLQIDQQNQSLQSLTKENNELKKMLHTQHSENGPSFQVNARLIPRNITPTKPRWHAGCDHANPDSEHSRDAHHEGHKGSRSRSEQPGSHGLAIQN